jgi:hypothetical protein
MVNDAYVKELFRSALRVLVDLGVRCGLSPQELEHELSVAVSEVTRNPPEMPSSSIDVRTNQFLASIVGYWGRTPKYVNDLGEPRALPRHGSNVSLATLFHDTLQSMRPAARSISEQMAIDGLIKNRVIAAGADGLWRKMVDVVPANTADSVGVDMQLRYLAEFSETIAYNTSQPGGQGRFCNVASVYGFPRDQLGRLNSMCQDSGMTLLKQIDEFLVSERHKHRHSPTSELVRAGVGVYLIEREIDGVLPGH